MNVGTLERLLARAESDSGGFLFAWGSSVPSAEAGYSVGGLFLDTSAGALYKNTGTKSSCTFTEVSASAVQTLADDAAITFGTGSDVTVKFNAQDLEFLPTVDDTGAFNIGDGTTDMDFKVFMGATTSYVLFDNGSQYVTFEGTDIHMMDNDLIKFGDAQDATIAWDAANLEILPKTDDTGAVNIGDGTTDMDLKVFMGSTGAYVLFDNGSQLVKVEGTNVQLMDDDDLIFGDSNEVIIQYDEDGTNDLQITGLAANGVGIAATAGTGAAGTNVGGGFAFTAGVGGAGTASTGGAGGAFTATAAVGGADTTGTGGAGGAATVTSGAGGATTGAGGTGGAGGAVSITGGAGGADGEGSAGTGGAGASITLTPGVGGAGNTAGADGAIVLSGKVDVNPLGHNVDLEGINSRYRLVWVAGARGKPSANGDIQNAAEGTRMIADPDFEVLGTNASSDDVTYYAEGGITLQTDGADGDEVIILPHLDANQSAWTQVTWGTDQEVRWECSFTTGSDITDCIVWAGLKLTNTEVTATDADQAFFRYENAVNSGKWQAISSIGDSDDAHDSGVTVAASTKYHLVIEIASDRTAKFYIDDKLVETSAALTDATDLIPYIGVAADGAGEAKDLHVHGQAISRTIA